jgi:UDP-N-acetylglucosamine 2-epimerase (hydrolysing)
MKKKIIFLTGTRADFGKLKSLIEVVRNSPLFEVHIFATGMHMDSKYGLTVNEIEKCGYDNIFKFINHDSESSMDITLSRTIEGFANYIRFISPDLIVVHGDRIEALAGATVGALNNILVAHIEGGELSGTIDELIRHAVSKLSHAHFVANEEAKIRLCQMGERAETICVIGSPDMDAMLSDNLPSIEDVKGHYEIPFEQYSISLFHPVTTEVDEMDQHANNYFAALEKSNLNYIVIYPNNDKGCDFILNRIKKLGSNPKFKIFPSVRFEAFLVLMKYASFIAGNSSAGIREAPYYGIPTLNIGTRQNGRTNNDDIIHTDYRLSSVLEGLQEALNKKILPKHLFGEGKSDEKFLAVLETKDFWSISKQKLFDEQKAKRKEEAVV